jgi:predicted MFS family arabinose efflux permease
VIGPAVAGMVYAWLGPAWCFTINGISFIAVIIALSLMKIAAQPIIVTEQSPLKHLMEGIRFVLNEPRIRVILVYVAIVSVFGFSLMTLAPAWAVKILGGDVRTNGWMLTARGVGSLIGALMIAYIGSKKIRQKIWLVGWYVMPFILLGFGMLRWIPGSLIFLVFLGWSLMAVLNISNALIQSYVPDHMRGRVMGVYTLVFMGTGPIGSLIVGGVASKFGEPAMVYVSVVVVTIAVLATFFFRKTITQF